MIKPTGAANYAVSRQGTLFYVPGGVSVQMTPRSLVWVDRKGHEEPIKAPLRAYGTPRISPDGTRAAARHHRSGEQRHLDLGLRAGDAEALDLRSWRRWTGGLDARRPADHLHVGPRGRPEPVQPGRRRHRYRRPADDEREPAVPDVHHAGRDTGSSASTRLPRTVRRRPAVFRLTTCRGADRGPVQRPVSSQSPVEPLAETLFDGAWPDFSPNGRYLAYQSDESGRSEVYVRPFPHVDSGRWQISTAGGTRPAWARSGRELFYLDASNTLTAVPVQTSGSTFSAGKPAKVFDTKYAEPNPSRHYDVSADGQRFLMLKDSAAGDPNATPASMVVVEHWFEELKQRVNGK